MKTFEINIPENCLVSNIGFATTLVSKACEFTSEDINIRTDDGTYVNLKSILGVLTLNYHHAKVLSIQVVGEMEALTASTLERFINNELKKYNS